MRAATGLLVLLVTGLAPVWTAAGSDARVQALVERARQDKVALNYQRALLTLDEALALGRSGPREVAEIHRLRGEMAAGLGDEPAAIASFTRFLSLAPGAELPEGTSPKLTAPFEQARLSLAGAYLRVRVASEDGAAVLVVDSDPAGLVAGARARQPGGAGVVTRGTGTIRLELPAGGASQVAAIDEHGNELAVVVSRISVLEGSTPPSYARWTTYGAAAAVFVAGGTYFGLSMRADQRELDRLHRDSTVHTYSEVEGVEERGRRNALLANLSFGAAAAAGITAAVLLGLETRDVEERRVTVNPAPVAGGGGVVTVELVF